MVTAEGSMRSLQKGDIIQIERRGFYFIDGIPFGENSKYLKLNFIPDGSTKEMSKNLTGALDAKEQSKGKGGAGMAGANKAE